MKDKFCSLILAVTTSLINFQLQAGTCECTLAHDRSSKKTTSLSIETKNEKRSMTYNFKHEL